MEDQATIAIRMAKEMQSKVHSGPIHSSVAGRTDHLPMHVKHGSYVIPADIISALGEGNTMAGYKIAKDIFSPDNKSYVSTGMPYGASGMPYGVTKPHKDGGGSNLGLIDHALHAAAGGRRAGAGRGAPESVQETAQGAVPIIAAGGEYVIPPDDVIHIGKGSLDDGHKILDHFVNKFRAKTIKTLSKLPGPKND
jgi:hypothetical protein